jgi:hypothetical protein
MRLLTRDEVDPPDVFDEAVAAELAALTAKQAGQLRRLRRDPVADAKAANEAALRAEHPAVTTIRHTVDDTPDGVVVSTTGKA